MDDSYVWLPWHCHLPWSSLVQSVEALKAWSVEALKAWSQHLRAAGPAAEAAAETAAEGEGEGEGEAASRRIFIAGSSQQRTLFFDVSKALGSLQVRMLTCAAVC